MSLILDKEVTIRFTEASDLANISGKIIGTEADMIFLELCSGRIVAYSIYVIESVELL